MDKLEEGQKIRYIGKDKELKGEYIIVKVDKIGNKRYYKVNDWLGFERKEIERIK